MIQVLLLTRGQLAEAWLSASESVCGEPAEGMGCLSLAVEGALEEERARVRSSIRELRARGPVLVLTDLHGSTPTNLACEYADDDQLAIIAGANLAMVLCLACDQRSERDLQATCEWICEKGRASIRQIRPSAGRDCS